MRRQSWVANLAGSAEYRRPLRWLMRLVHREGQLVRVAGWILLIAGALLCATLVWATIGFLLMGVGLLSLLVAENQRRRANGPIVSGAPADEPMAQPSPVPEPVQIVSREARKRMSASAPSYDQQAWRQLVESDTDLARVTAVLADYGQQYVDELASEYLADIDKQRLPAIVDGIIGRASKSVAPYPHAGPAVDASLPNPVGGPTAARERRPLPEPILKLSENLTDSGAPGDPPTAFDPEPDAGDGNKRIISADEELTAMLGRLSQDAATPSKN